METDLKGKVVLITGAAGGIGTELVRSFAHEGAKVGIHCHLQLEKARALANSLTTPTHVVSGNLAQEAEVQRVFESVKKNLGPIDILIANAGIWPEKAVPIADMQLAQWNTTLATNLTSYFLCLREFFRGIREAQLSSPAAVLIGSTAGIYGEAGHCDYAASKSAAIYGLMLSLKNELTRISPQGRINSICPGWVKTPMAGDIADRPEELKQILATVPLRKIALPTDVARAAVFLTSSSLSGHMTGQQLVVAGGMEGRQLYRPEEIDVSRA